MKASPLLSSFVIAAMTIPFSVHALNWSGDGADPKEWNDAANWNGVLPTGTQAINFGDASTLDNAFGGTTDFTTTGFMYLYENSTVNWESNDLTTGRLFIQNTTGTGQTLNVSGGNVLINGTAKIGSGKNVLAAFNMTGGSFTSTGALEINTGDDSTVTVSISGDSVLQSNSKFLMSNSSGGTLNWTVSGQDFTIANDRQAFQTGAGSSSSTTNLRLELGTTDFGSFTVGNWAKNGSVVNNLTVDVSSYAGTDDILLIDGLNNLAGFWDTSIVVGGVGSIDFDTAEGDIYYRFAPIPEPGTLTLLGLGGCALVLLNRRRR
ncbi:MAG: PEP-CTERM sorting domain-containing protein [Chthoniobacterales bacterium]